VPVPGHGALEEVELTTLGEDYLAQFGSECVRDYHRYLTYGQRIGQAFMNALPLKERARLTGTLVDCFYKNDNSVADAIEYLWSIEDQLRGSRR